MSLFRSGFLLLAVVSVVFSAFGLNVLAATSDKQPTLIYIIQNQKDFSVGELLRETAVEVEYVDLQTGQNQILKKDTRSNCVLQSRKSRQFRRSASPSTWHGKPFRRWAAAIRLATSWLLTGRWFTRPSEGTAGLRLASR